MTIKVIVATSLLFVSILSFGHHEAPCLVPGECNCVTPECAAGLPPFKPYQPTYEGCLASCSLVSGLACTNALKPAWGAVARCHTETKALCAVFCDEHYPKRD